MFPGLFHSVSFNCRRLKDFVLRIGAGLVAYALLGIYRELLKSGPIISRSKSLPATAFIICSTPTWPRLQCRYAISIFFLPLYAPNIFQTELEKEYSLTLGCKPCHYSGFYYIAKTMFQAVILFELKLKCDGSLNRTMRYSCKFQYAFRNILCFTFKLVNLFNKESQWKILLCHLLTSLKVLEIVHSK